MKYVFLLRPLASPSLPYPEVSGTVEVTLPTSVAALDPVRLEALVFDNVDTESNPYHYEFRALTPPSLEGRLRDVFGPWRRFLLDSFAYRDAMKSA